MPYSDLSMKNASQVAYKNLDQPFSQLKSAGKTPPFTIAELCAEKGTTVDALFPDLDGQDISNWKIVDCYNTNDSTGFYGCVIDIGGGDAIIAFRGSEGATNLSNLQHDWLQADLGLLNNTLTTQQNEVYKFLKQVSESDYIDNYDSLGMTGHSLGGNLAMHGSVVSAMPEIGLSDKLERCVSLDGPGFSDEYLHKYGKYIDEVSGKITHYKWSPVGGLLSEFPDCPRIPLKYTERSDFLYNIITRHSMESIEFDGENARRGEESTWDYLTAKFSQGLDHMPRIVGDILVLTVSSLAYFSIWSYNEMFDENNNLTPFGYGVIIAAAIFVITFGPIKTILLITTILFVTVIAFLAVVLFELIYELIEFIINAIVDAVVEICEWIKEKIQEFRDFVVKCLKDIKKWYNSHFNAGYKYATAHPQVLVDTYKLRTYADRIDAVHRRIKNLDTRLDSLYWKVGLLDLWNLMQADLLTGYSWRLARCSSYLRDTASDYETTENTLSSAL